MALREQLHVLLSSLSKLTLTVPTSKRLLQLTQAHQHPGPKLKFSGICFQAYTFAIDYRRRH